MKSPLYYITSNSGKFHEAELILEPHLSEKTRFFLAQKELSLDEIQGSIEDITRHKAQSAFQLNQGLPVIVDDVSFHIDALNGLPGPYIKAFLEQLGEDGIWSVVEKLGKTSCQAVCSIGFMRDEKEGPYLFTGKVYGDVFPPKGETRHGKQSWNAIFRPKGMDRNIGELSMSEISRLSPRAKALSQLMEFLLMEGLN